MGLKAGDTVGGRFEVLGVLGRGGTATVYLADDRVRGERVALKVVHAHLAGSVVTRSRLRREVAAAARLSHPGALVAQEVIDAPEGLAARLPFHAGVTLAEAVERDGPMSSSALRDLARRLASVLAAAHRAGLVHRDVTPSNVLIGDDGDAVLTDFGLARLAGRETATGTGALGTPGFAAPETYRGQRADPRSDLYGLGAVLYVAATGVAPFAASDAMTILARQLDDDRVPLASARPDLASELTTLVDVLLSPAPDDRPSGATQVLDVLAGRRVLAGTRPTTPPPSPAPLVPVLPEGDVTVVVRERRDDGRRRRRQRRHGLGTKPALERDMAEGFERLRRTVMEGWLGLSPKRDPEQQLASAVAQAAGLPGDALEIPSAVYERAFRLVERTDTFTAERLSEQARDAGFLASVAPVTVPATTKRWDKRALRTLGVVIAALLVTSVVGEIGAGLVFSEAIPIGLLAAILVPITLLRAGRLKTASTPLPVAFPRDLTPYLDVEMRARVSASGRPAGPVPTPVPPAPTNPPSPSPPRPDARPEVVARALDRLAALDALLAERAPALPRAVCADLRSTTRSLRDGVRRLATALGALTGRLDGADEATSADAADRVQARLERLKTLRRAGEAGRDDEIARLTETLAVHRDALEDMDRLDGQRAAIMAQLLEVSATADRCSATLLDPSDALGDVSRLGRDLREQAGLARAAAHEVARAGQSLSVR